MRQLVFVVLLLISFALCEASVVGYHGYNLFPVVSPYAISSQYHSQDGLGQYSYGYSGGPSAKHETKTLDGITRGGYSYIDPDGRLQSVVYTADDVNGFRVAATNLPVGPASAVSTPVVAVSPVQDTAEIVAARAAQLAALRASVQESAEVEKAKGEHLAAVEKTKTDLHSTVVVHPHLSPVTPDINSNSIVGDTVSVVSSGDVSKPYLVSPDAIHSVSYSPVSVPAIKYYYPGLHVSQYSPVPSHVLSPLLSQYHAQDELGQYSYGYSGGPSAKQETRTADGVTRGGYSYIDGNGIVQTVKYISDPVNGFRVAATNLPVGPGVASAA